jgi:hypothetical protein
MIEFLTAATLVYALILVVALAVSLSTILYYLWSIGTTLGRIRAGLGVVRDQTAPLGGQVTAINDALGQTAGGLARAREDLLAVDAALAELAGEAGPAERVA